MEAGERTPYQVIQKVLGKFSANNGPVRRVLGVPPADQFDVFWEMLKRVDEETMLIDDPYSIAQQVAGGENNYVYLLKQSELLASVSGGIVVSKNVIQKLATLLSEAVPTPKKRGRPKKPKPLEPPEPPMSPKEKSPMKTRRKKRRKYRRRPGPKPGARTVNGWGKRAAKQHESLAVLEKKLHKVNAQRGEVLRQMREIIDRL